VTTAHGTIKRAVNTSEVDQMADEKNEVVETAAEPKAAPSKNIEKILESIEKMTVLEMAELVKALEDKFGVSAAAPMAMMAAPAAGGAAAGGDEEKTEWDVILSVTGEKKFQVVKVIRQVTDLGLKEAKELVDNPGQVVKKDISKDEAEEVKKKLEEAGAKAEIK
jgi:large subunit ribosomal protein L7/L12